MMRTALGPSLATETCFPAISPTHQVPGTTSSRCMRPADKSSTAASGLAGFLWMTAAQMQETCTAPASPSPIWWFLVPSFKDLSQPNVEIPQLLLLLLRLLLCQLL